MQIKYLSFLLIYIYTYIFIHIQLFYFYIYKDDCKQHSYMHIYKHIYIQIFTSYHIYLGAMIYAMVDIAHTVFREANSTVLKTIAKDGTIVAVEVYIDVYTCMYINVSGKHFRKQ